MPRAVKYLLLPSGFLAMALSGALALAPNSAGIMGHGCMQMMQGMHSGSSHQPNEQWRGRDRGPPSPEDAGPNR